MFSDSYKIHKFSVSTTCLYLNLPLSSESVMWHRISSLIALSYFPLKRQNISLYVSFSYLGVVNSPNGRAFSIFFRCSKPRRYALVPVSCAFMFVDKHLVDFWMDTYNHSINLFECLWKYLRNRWKIQNIAKPSQHVSQLKLKQRFVRAYVI